MLKYLDILKSWTSGTTVKCIVPHGIRPMYGELWHKNILQCRQPLILTSGRQGPGGPAAVSDFRMCSTPLTRQPPFLRFAIYPKNISTQILQAVLLVSMHFLLDLLLLILHHLPSAAPAFGDECPLQNLDQSNSMNRPITPILMKLRHSG